MELRKAKNTDVHGMRALINEMAARTDTDYKHGHMLPRSLTELYEHVRDYFVLVSDDDQLLGCCALQSTWDGLGELKALAVADSIQGQGLGRQLVEATLSEAEALGIECVFTLTNKMAFFEKLGFVPIDMRELPQRVWSECTNCPKFMVACDEVAMTYQGRRPRQTYIPAVGVNAPAAARVALGLAPINDSPPPPPLTATPGATAQNVPAVGPMNTDGVHPPFAPRPDDESTP